MSCCSGDTPATEEGQYKSAVPLDGILEVLANPLASLARQAIKFWCDSITAINANDIKPVKLCGVKVRFERKVP